MMHDPQTPLPLETHFRSSANPSPHEPDIKSLVHERQQKRAKATIQAQRLQDIAMADCLDPKTKPHIRAALMRAWCDLNEQIRVMKMKPLPKSVDVTKWKGNLSKRALNAVAFAEPTEPGEPVEPVDPPAKRSPGRPRKHAAPNSPQAIPPATMPLADDVDLPPE